MPASFAHQSIFRVYLLSVCVLGVSALITQLVLMREMLAALSGNEMVLGIVLGNWLLLSGVGAALGRLSMRWRRPINLLAVAQVFIALLPLVSLLAVRTLRNVVFLRGAELGVGAVILSSLVVLAPYCLLAGFLLTVACRLLARERGPDGIGRAYFLDTIGDVIGGLLFTFVLAQWTNHVQALVVPAVANLVLSCMLCAAGRMRMALGCIAGLLAGLVMTVSAVDLNVLSLRAQYPGQQVLFARNSPYGSVLVTETAGQLNFLENGVVLFSTQNIDEVEEVVHYPMVQRPTARRVLLIAGGTSGTAREVLKYGVERVDYVELDPLITEVAHRFVPDSLADARIVVHHWDGRRFLAQATALYDVVIVDLPDPSTSQLVRFYTREFFKEAKRALVPGGVLAFSLGRYENYAGPELVRMLATAHRTVQEVFRHVLLLPGGSVFFLASDDSLSTQIAERLTDAHIETLFLRPSYLAAMLAPDRMADLGRAVAVPAPLNTDFVPILYYYQLRYWQRRFEERPEWWLPFLIVCLLAYLVRQSRVTLAVFAGGFAASSLQVILLFAFQILFGCVYHRVGLIVTLFMLGLGLGALFVHRRAGLNTRKDLAGLQGCIAMCAALLPAVIYGLQRLGAGWLGTLPGQGTLYLFAFGLAFLVGAVFPLAGRVQFAGVVPTAARLYTADLIGAALGALLVSAWLLPVWGITWVCLLAAGLTGLAGLVLVARRGIYPE